MKRRPIDISKKLKISTSALRHYETRGFIPLVPRSSSGYRLYTDDHIAYFECIQAMSFGFGMEMIEKVLKYIQNGNKNAAFLLVNEAQANLYQKRIVSEKLLETIVLEPSNVLNEDNEKEWYTIGEVSAKTKIPSSAIRHWDKTGLLTSHRDINNYRKFNHADIQKIRLIGSLRSFIYSLDLIHLKKALKDFDHHSEKQVQKIARDSLHYIYQVNQQQMQGIHSLYRLCRQVQLI